MKAWRTITSMNPSSGGTRVGGISDVVWTFLGWNGDLEVWKSGYEGKSTVRYQLYDPVANRRVRVWWEAK